MKKYSKRKKNSILLVGIPGPGMIGTMALTYVVHSLKLDLIGEINSSSSIIFIDEGQINGPIRIYNKNNIFVIISDIPIDYDIAPLFTESILDFALKNKINYLIFLSGIQGAERNAPNLKTYGLVTHERLEKILYDNEIPKFLTGIVSGPDAIILSRLKISRIPTLILYTECSYFFPDPDAALQTIKVLSRLMRAEMDLTEFKKQVDYLRLQNRQLMEDTLNIMQTQKQPSLPPPIYK